MKKKITLIIAVLTLSIATLTGCGSSEDLKSTIEKMDTVEINDLVEKNKDKTEDEIKKALDEKNQSEDKKEDTKTNDEKKDDDKKSETAEKKEDTKSDDKKADTGKTDNKTASNDTKKDTPKSESPKQESKPSGSTNNGNKNTSTGGNKTEAPKGCSHDWKPNYRTVTVKAAYDEQVKVKDAWDETVTVKDAWSENVLVTAAWDEVVNDVVVDEYSLCGCGFQARSKAEIQQHAFEKLMNPEEAAARGCSSWTNKTVYGSRTIHHDAVYQTVNHPAETKNVHHDAEYKTVHHDAQTKQEVAGYTCSKCGAKK